MKKKQSNNNMPKISKKKRETQNKHVKKKDFWKGVWKREAKKKNTGIAVKRAFWGYLKPNRNKQAKTKPNQSKQFKKQVLDEKQQQ